MDQVPQPPPPAPSPLSPSPPLSCTPAAPFSFMNVYMRVMSAWWCHVLRTPCFMSVCFPVWLTQPVQKGLRCMYLPVCTPELAFLSYCPLFSHATSCPVVGCILRTLRSKYVVVSVYRSCLVKSHVLRRPDPPSPPPRRPPPPEVPRERAASERLPPPACRTPYPPPPSILLRNALLSLA
jgi:hypothetical protein